ncbi:hypothetical protein PPERSA_07317 [Pseudocohnilembus persalinus]|uniref:Uncharacterized protein n=1 Tax=Pseudocohnilembus persalinus TaxID=266149 RepID=A0A0V0R7T6_PSEPJ|nr:hypothetical protein PPERSA_07317 [Pseudocohnilembus persalinus]|eukprot:KRX10232.1 hypothetical protein PPERSA_07317 [Pseudocohnilembus persalinus]
MESSVQGLKEKIIILKEEIQQRRENAEQFFDNQQETIYVLENQIQTDIQDLKQNLQDYESINEKNLEEQKWKTNNEIMEQNNIQEQKLSDQIVGKIKHQVPDIQNRVNIEECQRQECDKMILDITASNLKKINGQITNQQKKSMMNQFNQVEKQLKYPDQNTV